MADSSLDLKAPTVVVTPDSKALTWSFISDAGAADPEGGTVSREAALEQRMTQAGFTPAEIAADRDRRKQKMSAAGFSDAEVFKAFDPEGLSSHDRAIADAQNKRPAFNAAPVQKLMTTNLANAAAPTEAHGFMQALDAGFQTSAFGLAARGEMPSLSLGENATRGEKVGAAIGNFGADLPTMMAGAVLGGVAGVETGPGAAATALGGAFALPAGLRSVMMDAYSNGEVTGFSDFMHRAASTLWDTSKAWLTGAATSVAGGAVTKMLPAVTKMLPAGAGAAVRFAAPTAAELGTMVTVGDALNGQVPTADEFITGGLVLGAGKAAVAASRALRNIYSATGVKPSQVVADAQGDPELWHAIVADPDHLPPKYDSVAQSATGNAAGEALAKQVEQAKAKAVAPQSVPTGAEKIEPTLSPEAAKRAQNYLEKPFSDLPQMPGQPAEPTHVNYNYVDSPQTVKETLSRLSELYEGKIQEQRRGAVNWETTYAEAEKEYAALIGVKSADVAKLIDREPGTAAGAAELWARKDMAVGAAELLMKKRAEMVFKGPSATPADLVDFMAQVERTGILMSEFLGARAEAGRALNILKSTKRMSEQLVDMQDLINQSGGEQGIKDLIDRLGDYSDPANVLRFAQEANKPTFWNQAMEAFRAGLLTGLRTHEVNMLSNTVFAAMRIPKQTIAAAFGSLRGEDKVYFSESVAMTIGMLKGSLDGLKVAGSVVKNWGDIGEKSEQHQPSIPGVIGDVVRTPFVFMSAEDNWARTVNEQGSAYALAVRKTLDEKIPFISPQFAERVTELARNPTPDMLKANKADAERFTFNKPLNKAGAAFKNFVSEAHLEWLFPFITTPGNIFKEALRMVPGPNLAIKEWREDFAAGGTKRDLALAEVAMGGTVMAGVFALANNGQITGGGTPEPGQRPVDRAAGWKPYSIKIGDKYIEGYNRMAPAGQLIGLAADASEMWRYMSQDEHDKMAKMLAFAFANNVTNQSYMQSFTTALNAVQDPGRYGDNYAQQMAGSVIPNAAAQLAAWQDPYMRQTNSVLEALRSRIPNQREGLMPTKDIFGDPIKQPDQLWLGSPFSVSPISNDKVRTEAAHIGFAAPSVPKKLDVLETELPTPAGKVQLTDEQRDVFNTVQGQLAHQILTELVSSPDWDPMPVVLKRQIFQNVFSESATYAKVQALGMDERAIDIDTAATKLMKELTTPDAQTGRSAVPAYLAGQH